MLDESLSTNASPPSSLNDSGSGTSRGVTVVRVCGRGASAAGPDGLHALSNTVQNTSTEKDDDRSVTRELCRAEVFVMISRIEVAMQNVPGGRKSARKPRSRQE